MKKYLLWGLAIIFVTNAVVLVGVYNNRSDIRSQLTLSERELSLPNEYGFEKENSGILLDIKWRIPSNINGGLRYGIEISKEEIIALGFSHLTISGKNRDSSKTLYWAFELDGPLYMQALAEAEADYQIAIAKALNDPKAERLKEDAIYQLSLAKNAESRLFYLDIAKDYQTLAKKYGDKRNILISKGLTRLYTSGYHKTYRLTLDKLLVTDIMVPVQYSDVFEQLESLNEIAWRQVTPPRYEVDVNWGRRLEPWVVGVRKLTVAVDEP